MGHIGGWLMEKEDRDALNALAAPTPDIVTALASDVPIAPCLDLRKYIPRRSQKNEGSCNGHGKTFCDEVAYLLKTRKFKRFSPDFAYYMAQKMDGIRGDSGSTITGGMRVALEIGSLEEEAMPYTPRYNPEDVPGDYKEKAAPYRLAKGMRLKTYREIVEWWNRGLGGCWWGIPWGLRESKPGWITRFSAGGGGHAIGIGMWGEDGTPCPMDSDGLPQWLWQTNSWTDNPQEVSINGYCRITRDAVEAALEHPYTVVVGVTDMEHVRIRPISWGETPPV